MRIDGGWRKPTNRDRQGCKKGSRELEKKEYAHALVAGVEWEWMSPEPQDEVAGEKAPLAPESCRTRCSEAIGPAESAMSKESSTKSRHTNGCKRSLQTGRQIKYINGCACEEGIRS
jgi:hypothetical protein